MSIPFDPLWLLLLLPTVPVLALGLVRLRVEARVSDAGREVYLGLGQLGLELDLKGWRARVRLFGWRPVSFALKKEADAEAEVPDPDEEPAAKAERRRPFGDLWAALSRSADPLLRFVAGLWRGTDVEVVEVHVVGSLGEPHLTGMALGAYFAATGIVPGLAGRLSFEPDFVGEELTGEARLAAAMPIYRLGLLLGLLVLRLPLRGWWRVARGRESAAVG